MYTAREREGGATVEGGGTSCTSECVRVPWVRGDAPAPGWCLEPVSEAAALAPSDAGL